MSLCVAPWLWGTSCNGFCFAGRLQFSLTFNIWSWCSSQWKTGVHCWYYSQKQNSLEWGQKKNLLREKLSEVFACRRFRFKILLAHLELNKLTVWLAHLWSLIVVSCNPEKGFYFLSFSYKIMSYLNDNLGTIAEKKKQLYFKDEHGGCDITHSFWRSR